MNTCPVYRRSGGYSYNSTVPGPIGSILSPAMGLHAADVNIALGALITLIRSETAAYLRRP